VFVLSKKRRFFAQDPSLSGGVSSRARLSPRILLSACPLTLTPPPPLPPPDPLSFWLGHGLRALATSSLHSFLAWAARAQYRATFPLAKQSHPRRGAWRGLTGRGWPLDVDLLPALFCRWVFALPRPALRTA
jgi:hypothetical protein